MHSKALAALFGLSLVACTGVIDGGGPGGGGDDIGGESCGDGVTQSGEGCDDGNNLSGDGCSSSCTTEQALMPRVMATVDKVTINTELGMTEKLEVTFTSVDGFTGPVNLAATVDYGAGADGAWMVTASKPSVDLVDGGTDSIALDVVIPSDTAALAGTVTLAATSAVDPVSLSSTVNVANQYTVVIPPGTGAAIPHAYTGARVIRLRAGATIQWKNEDTVNHRIHGNGAIPHEEPAPAGGAPGSTYQVTVLEAGSGTWYCHEHNEDNFSRAVQVQ